MSKNRLFILILCIVILISLILYKKTGNTSQKQTTSSTYNPSITPSNFTTEITNPYFSLTPGKTFHYEKGSGNSLETVDVVITNNTKILMGVTTREVRDTSRINGTLLEDTYDWYAQDKEGNVWYFGESVDNYSKGQIINHNGSWFAGQDGALPGIVMPANPTVGQKYRQEYYIGKAEDLGEIVSLNESVAVKAGSFNGCLKTKDTSAIEPSLLEYKYYCKEVGMTVKSHPISDPADAEDLFRIEKTTIE